MKNFIRMVTGSLMLVTLLCCGGVSPIAPDLAQPNLSVRAATQTAKISTVCNTSIVVNKACVDTTLSAWRITYDPNKKKAADAAAVFNAELAAGTTWMQYTKGSNSYRIVGGTHITSAKWKSGTLTVSGSCTRAWFGFVVVSISIKAGAPVRSEPVGHVTIPCELKSKAVVGPGEPGGQFTATLSSGFPAKDIIAGQVLIVARHIQTNGSSTETLSAISPVYMYR